MLNLLVSKFLMKVEKLIALVLIVSILCLAAFIRVQGTTNVPAGQLTGPDGYFYYWQAQLISEHGKLPEQDMNRWLPLGRDLTQTLNLYGYVLAYAHIGIARIFPDITLYHVIIYTPVVCFCIGLGALCLLFYRTFGILFSSIVGVLLATLPGAITRSAAGFGDRDSWCLMLGILAVTTYLASLQSQQPRKCLLWTLASGFAMFLGGVSWEGFGVFLSIILLVEIWRFLTSETEDRLWVYLIWVCTFVPPLYLVSPAYRSGQGFSTHIAALMLAPPLALLVIRYLRHLLITKVSFSEKLRPHARTLALGLTLASITLALGYTLMQYKTFADTTVPFSQNTLMQNIEELESTFLIYWMTHYGSVFVLGSLGIAMTIFRFWKIRGLVFAAPLILFTGTTFYRSVLDSLLGTSVVNMLFGIAIVTCVIGFLILAWRRQGSVENEFIYIAFIVWFLFWVALARDAKRYNFFVGVSIAFFTTDLLIFLATFYANKVKHRVPQLLLKTAIPALMLTLILFYSPVGGHANRALSTAIKSRRAIPGRGSLAHAFDWIKGNLPASAVVAAHWNHGSQLNVIAGVKTIVDQDHYIPHWIDLYRRHVNFAKTEREALEFLKSHSATHIMLTGKETATAPFLRGEPSRAFVPIYPTNNFAKALVKVWEIRYPSDIRSNPKYLATQVPIQ